MMRKLSTWLVVASAGGLLVGGCGSGSTTSTQTVPAAATTSPTTATNGAAAATSPTTATKARALGAGATHAKPEPKAQQGLAACKRTINAERTLPASAKRKLVAELCERFARTTSQTSPPETGRVIPLSNAARVCLERVSQLPAGAARLRALAACKAN